MDEKLYNKAMTCPVCSKEIQVTKVKSKATRVDSRDTDFCVRYVDLNPLLYEIWVCGYCGYAAHQENFEKISHKESQLITGAITPKWHPRDFSGERDLCAALEAFKIALLNLHVRNAKASELAKLCLRIGWLYRLKQEEKENEFLGFALRHYKEAYEKEHFPIEKMDEYTCLFMIAELSRRTGALEESVKWFSKLIGDPGARSNPRLIEQAREQYQMVKDQMQGTQEGDASA